MKSVSELHLLEHNLQSLLAQKQAFEAELAEISNALDEVKKTTEEVYKVAGSVMFKAEKSSLILELEEKKKVIGLRISSIEKQEKILETKSEELRKEFLPSTKKD